MNTMTISGYQAVIAFDPDIQMFRGEFAGLNGGADFYAPIKRTPTLANIKPIGSYTVCK